MSLPHQVTHSPYQLPPGYPAVPPAEPETRQVFNGMVHIMDEAVGNLTAALRQKQMLDATLLLFSADKCAVTVPCSHLPYRALSSACNCWSAG